MTKSQDALDRVHQKEKEQGKSKPEVASNPIRNSFKQAVSDSGLSYSEIAKRAGLDRSTVSSIMRDNYRGSIDAWYYILEACDVEIGFRFRKPNEQARQQQILHRNPCR